MNTGSGGSYTVRGGGGGADEQLDSTSTVSRARTANAALFRREKLITFFLLDGLPCDVHRGADLVGMEEVGRPGPLPFGVFHDADHHAHDLELAGQHRAAAASGKG